MWIDRIQTGIMIWENNLRNPKGGGEVPCYKIRVKCAMDVYWKDWLMRSYKQVFLCFLFPKSKAKIRIYYLKKLVLLISSLLLYGLRTYFANFNFVKFV